MAKPKLTNDDYCRASKQLRCEVAAIKAVADTESRGEGFYADGFPVILYERHIFRKYTDGKYNKTHPELSGSQGNYGKPGANQRRKFSAAFELDPIAAMKACSWGKFQLMGFNYKVCGFSSVGAMIDAMKESEGRHLDGFVSFVKGNRLDDEIRHKDWAGFASGYNGSGYKINKYDTKMAIAYKRFAKENIDCSKVSAASQPPAPLPASTDSPIDDPQNPVPPTNIETPTQIAEQIINTGDNIPPDPPADGGAATDPAVQVSQGGFKSVVATVVGSIGGGVTALWGAFTSDTGIMVVGIICVTLLLLSLIFRQVLMDWLRMKLHADPTQGNVKSWATMLLPISGALLTLQILC